MSEQTNLVPKRRFKEFQNTDAWEQRKLKDFGKATGGTSIESEFVDGGKYKVISIGSYSEQSVYTDQNIRAELTDKTRNRVLNKDDLTMILNDKTASGNIIGRVLLIDSNDSYVYNQRTERIEPDHEKYDSQFLYQMLNAPMIRSKIIKQAQGNTQIYVNWSAIGELDYLVPNLDEQREIGAFFSNFDHLITLHQRKLEKAKALKLAYLSEMFPAEGERVPKRRFAGFTNAWEQHTISELADRYDNLRVPITASDRMPGNTPYYGANGIQDYVEGFTHCGEFILVAEDGANDLQNYPVQYVNGKVWVNNHAHVLQARSEIADNKFLMNALKQTNIEPYLVGGGRAKLNADVMMKISLRVPELAEQKKIGSFFERLDHLITLHQRKLEKLQNLKKAYLNEMFV
ncbi:restriction endonuclease subunit S [Heyndrickxia coagulans]|uniref:restriction endonuclease subunit S n=1 Tax=Heyndrickxia coagulans TaxID=1398 RepID=UPI002235DC98|nr:restriction endonuclease subunit S [Heyndrickxia coagulans]UZH05781.1 restriction endonuclease subunit S [Heyndrickxia coagulans]